MLKKLSSGFRSLFLVFFFSICFLLPFEPRFLATVEILTVLFFLLAHSPRSIFLRLRKRREAVPFFLFFLLTACSCFYSENKTEWARQVEVKLPFLVIPLLVWGAGIDRHRARTGILVFVAGCAAACTALLCLAGVDYIATGNDMVWLYTGFSRFMHVSYFGMYLLVCIAWLFMDGLEDRYVFPRKYTAAILLFMLCLVLVSAKITWVALIVSSLFFALYYARRRQQVLKALSIIGFFALLPLLLYLVSPNVRIRIDAIGKEIAGRHRYTAPQNMGSTTIRMVIWEDAWPQVCANLPWGTGAGDVQGMLIENYRKRDMQMAIEKKLNMHDEYLQQLAGLGIPGLLLFVFMAALPALLCRRPYRFAGFLFTFTVLTVALTESILERQAGTIFFCLAGVLLITAYGKETAPVPNS